jgi:plasmid stabilization system protein ParE
MPPRKRLEWRKEALGELEEAMAWYAERNPDAARRMKAAILAAAHDLIDPTAPVSGKPGRRPGTLEKVVGRSAPYTLVYRPSPTVPEVLQILHVTHHARDYP